MYSKYKFTSYSMATTYLIYFSNWFFIIIKSITYVFFCFLQQVYKGFLVSNKLNVLSVNKLVKLALSVNFILFFIHTLPWDRVRFFQHCACHNYAAVLVYKNKIPSFFPNCLSISPKRKTSNLNCILIFKFL